MTNIGSSDLPPLWTCPSCGKQYAIRHLWHSCVRVPLESLFEGRPRARELFDRLKSVLEEDGPLTIATSKTRIEFMTRVRFAGCQVRRDYLRAGFWLKRRVDSPRFVRVEEIPPNNWVYSFEIRDESDIDDEIRAFLREARMVGDQEHLARR